ncbi:hypothetical protein VaNZ11_006419 [Volvox africanus]|uniref:RING-type domain-containing protein n=1 Tax=Volvox africanus TaxID=51714 RepID=A0ABQ5S0M8_9CHLO|nr:hypothetical protein VaNZ11_006419 [Volvox africanus]
MNSFFCACFWPPGPKIPEEYLRPQGLYSLERVDLKKLKRLIQNQQLAPCHPGVEESSQGQDLEECPICFLHYPVLNSSLCCQKRVCTECFLQVQTSTPPHQLSACPFCKVTRPTGYLVKLIGVRTAEEKEQERVEEQKVIEARIREREEEIRRDQERALQRQQQLQAAAAASPVNRPPNSSTNANTNSPVQQQPSAGVMAAAAAAASALEPSGGNAAFAAVGRTSGRLATAAAASDPGSGQTGRYQSSDRQRLSSLATAGNPTATVVGGGGPGMHPAVSARRAAAAAAMSAAIQQHQQHQHQQQINHIQQPGDRYLIGPEGAGATGHADSSDNATAAAYGGGGGGHQRRHQVGGGGGRRYRLTDYVPAGVVDIAMGLDDINDLMLEQAMYESLAATAAASPPQAPPVVRASPTTSGSGGRAQGADEATLDVDENYVALAAALVASLNGVEGNDGTVLERPAQSPVVSRTAGTATAIDGSSMAVDAPAGRSEWHPASARAGDLDAVDEVGRSPNYAMTPRNGAAGTPALPSPTARGSRNAAASRQAAVAATMRSAPGNRAQPQPQPPQVAAAAVAVSPRLTRVATPSQLALARGSSPTAPGFRAWERRDTADREAGREPAEEEDEDALISRRTANTSTVSSMQPSADTYPLSAVSGTAVELAARSDAAPLLPQGDGGGVAATPESNCQELGAPAGLSAAAAAIPATAVASDVAVRVGSASVGVPTPITLSPVPSDGRVGALGAVASELSSAATGNAAPRDDLLEAVAVRAPGSQHLTNPLYDMWSNSSSATTCKHPCLDTPAPAAGGLAAVGPQEESGRPDGSPAGASGATSAPSTAALARWGVKCSSERSSLGSEGGIVMQQCSGQDKHRTKQRQQHEAALELPTAVPSSPIADSVVATITEYDVSLERCQPSRMQPPPPLAVSIPSAALEAVRAAAAAPRSATVTLPSPVCTPGSCGTVATPSPRLGLPPLDLSPPATGTTTATTVVRITATGEDTPAGGPSPDVLMDTSVTTVVTIQTLAAELLRHSSGAAAMAAAAAAGSSEASSTSSHVVTVGMVFKALDTAPGGSRQPPPASQLAAAPMEGPAWVENPDGSLQVLLPADGGSTSMANTTAATAKGPRKQRRTGDGRAGNADQLMDVPYADYDLPAIQPLPSLDMVGYDLPSTVPYIAGGGREPAPVGFEDVVPEKVEETDEVLVDICNETDARLKRLMAASDAAVAAAIAAGDRRVRGNTGIN